MSAKKTVMVGFIFLFILAFAASCTLRNEVFSGRDQRAVKRLQLSIPYDTMRIECLHESHGGMQSDGDSVFKLTFSKDASEYFSGWNEMPISEEAEACILMSAAILPITEELKNRAERASDTSEFAEFVEYFDVILLPEVERGLWKLVNRGENAGRITDFTFCIYDAESNTAYIIESDM